MTFTEAVNVEILVRDLPCGDIFRFTAYTTAGPRFALREGELSDLGRHYRAAADVPRQMRNILVQDLIHDAIIRLDTKLSCVPYGADEVLYKPRINGSVLCDALIRGYVSPLTSQGTRHA